MINGKSETSLLLKTIQVHQKNKKYKVKEQVLYSKNMDTLYMAANTVAKKLTVSAKTRYIARGAFYENYICGPDSLVISSAKVIDCVHGSGWIFVYPGQEESFYKNCG